MATAALLLEMVRMDTQMSDEERATVAEAMRRQFHLNCLGNIAQIDTPYLTEGSSGITYVVDRFKGWPHSDHIAPQRGERSRLEDHAAEVL